MAGTKDRGVGRLPKATPHLPWRVMDEERGRGGTDSETHRAGRKRYSNAWGTTWVTMKAGFDWSMNGLLRRGWKSRWKCGK